MKIKDLQIDGFGVWTGLSVDAMPEGMTLFYGPNEAGKTTLMEFVRTVLYGFTSDRQRRYLPPLHGGSPGGTLRITGPGGGYQVRRRAQLGDEGNIGQLTVTGGDGVSQGQHRLSALLGQIDESIFTNVFAIGLRELQELSTLDDTAAADELYKLSSGLDRVSLVDVMRQLQGARGKLAGVTGTRQADNAPLQQLTAQRHKLRDEIDQLTRRGRRWSELASQRRSQQEEIARLRSRHGEWEREARIVEVATSVRDAWQKRAKLAHEIQQLQQQAQLPEDAPAELVRIEAQLEEKKEKLDTLRRQRLSLRDKANEVPVSRALVGLQNRIEAAAEQSPWLETIQEQIQRLDAQIDQATRSLEDDAQRLGLDDSDRLSLIEEGRTSALPDLSRSTLQTLAAPARVVREHLFQLKQSKSEGNLSRKEADKLAQALQESSELLGGMELSEAIKRQGETIGTFRKRQQTQEYLEKLKKLRDDLEREAVDLTTAEALPVDRTILLGVPFTVGGLGILYGIVKTFDLFGYGQAKQDDNYWGPISFILGIAFLAVWYLGRQLMDRGTSLDLEDCERQLENVRKQLKEVELERDQVESLLPSGSGSIETRMEEAETNLQQLEGLLPTFHNHQAAVQRYQQSRKRAGKAAIELKSARGQWQKTLRSMGLAESLSPASIRQMSDGYETLQASLRRLSQLREEREQRRKELLVISQRIESLHRQVMTPDDASQRGTRPAVTAPSTPSHASNGPRAGSDGRSESGGRKERGNQKGNDGRRDSSSGSHAAASANAGGVSAGLHSSGSHSSGGQSAGGSRREPLKLLQDITDELSRQRQWIDRRRDLKGQDDQLKKGYLQLRRSCERLDSMRQSVLVRCGVDSREAFDTLVEKKVRLEELRREHTSVDEKIRATIGKQCTYDDIVRELDGGKADELERRWDALTQKMQQTQERISQLQTRQGEIAQEMKQMASDRRLGEAQLELSVVEKQLLQLNEQWQSLATTSSLLDDVCKNYEQQRQPETLREASTFLKQLTAGKYTRVWTPLGTATLQVDNQNGQSLPLERLSRGTREAVFIALRLALAAAFARRGVMLPLVLDDVLVNFDRDRALHAAETLRDFAALGHQVLMFTCHEHITDIFDRVGVQIRLLPAQGKPAEAYIWRPDRYIDAAPAKVIERVVEPEPMPVFDLPVVEIEEPYLEDVPVVEAAVEELPIVDEPRFDEPLIEEESVIVTNVPVVRKKLTRVRAPEPVVDRLWYEEGTVDRSWFEADEPDLEPSAPPPQDLWWRDEAPSVRRSR
jgi:uncharacterized protein YhaN